MAKAAGVIFIVRSLQCIDESLAKQLQRSMERNARMNNMIDIQERFLIGEMERLGLKSKVEIVRIAFKKIKSIT